MARVRAMSTEYDFYANFRIDSKKDVDDLIRGSGRYSEIKDVLTGIMLLSTVFGVKGRWHNSRGRPRLDPKVYARVGEDSNASGLKALIHSNMSYNNYIASKLSELSSLGINTSLDLSTLPKGSWGVEFLMTLETPFISKDDVPLYIIENPVRKDKVFGVPFTSAAGWKGNLRWTMMKVHLEPNIKDPEKFAEMRFRHTLLFGTEKGMEDTPKGWAEYLNELCSGAQGLYLEKLKAKFGKNDVPKLGGMLHFYPTFWNGIDIEVINPHSRRTKTGKNPIYFETVPKGSKGFFRLIYVPLHWSRLSEDELKKNVLQDLHDVAIGLKDMMLTYGFSAKKSIGYGAVKEKWDENESKLIIKDFERDIERFGNFEELQQKVNRINEGFNNE